MKRKTLSQYLRDGSKVQHDGMCRNGYYAILDHPEIGPLYFLDPIMLIFVGKFGSDILGSIGKEHRLDFDDGWDKGRVWDREHVTERLTKAVNGGVWELHQRLHERPQLFDALRQRGYRGERKMTSVFRAITWLSDHEKLEAEQIAAVLEECKL